MKDYPFSSAVCWLLKMNSLMGETFDSTFDLMLEITKLTKFLTNHGSFGELQDELVNRGNEIIGEMEEFFPQFKKDCILFEEMSTKTHVENVELQGEFLVVIKERDNLMVEVARLKEDERIASERAKMVEDKLAKIIEEQTHMTNDEKSEMISKLNVQMSEKDKVLNKFRERLKVMEVKTRQKEQEILSSTEELTRSKEDVRKAKEWAKKLEETLANDGVEQSHMVNEKTEMISELNVKVTNLNNEVLEKDRKLNKFREKLKRMEMEVAQKEQEVDDMKHQDTADFKIMEEKLRNQVLVECDQMLSAWKEKLRLLEVKVLQKEQEVHDFKQQETVAYQVNEENLKKQVLERDQRLKDMEVKVLQREQEVNDLEHQNGAAYKIMEERLENHVLESDQLLNMCKGRLKCMEAKVIRLEQELRDLKHQQLASFQISEDKLKLMEVKVAQKEQEIHDLEHQQSEAYKVMEEKLKNDVLENHKMLNVYEEKFKVMEVKVVQREQKVDDLKRQILEFFQVGKEKLKFLEVKVEQKEQELLDFKHQKLAAYKINEEKLKNQVMGRNQMLNVGEEKLKSMEVKMAQKEQEFDLKHQILVAYQISTENLKNQVLERDNMLSTCEEKSKKLEEKVVQKEQEVHDLNHQKLAAYQIIRKLTHEQKEMNQREELLRRQNAEAYENAAKLKQPLLAIERDKSSDEELKDIKEKLLEADNNLEVLRRKNLVLLRAVEEFKEWMLAADKSFEPNKERWEGLPRIKIVEEGLIRVLKTKVLDLADSVLKEAVDVNLPIPIGGGGLLHMGIRIIEGSRNDNGSSLALDQAGTQSHSSPRVETCSRADLEQGTGKSESSASVQVAPTDGIARFGELDYHSDLPATVEGNISELPSRKQPLSLDTFSLRKRRFIGNAFEDIVSKILKKEQTKKPSHERCESISLNSPVAVNPVLRSCKEKVAASDSQIQIINIDSSSDEDPSGDSHMNDIVR